MTLSFFIAFSTAVLLFIMGWFVVCRNYKSEINISFGLICFSACFWQFTYSLAYNASNAEDALNWFRVGYPAVVFIAITYLHFTTTFLDIVWVKRVVYSNYIFGFLLAILFNQTDLFVNGVYDYFWGYYPKAGKFHPYFLAYFLVMLNTSCGQLAYYYFFKKNALSAVRKQQVKYILLALGIFTVASIDFIPNYGIEIYPFGFIAATIFLTIICYSIIKYRVMDMSLALTRTTIFIAVYSIVLGIPFALAFLGQLKLQAMLGENWWLVPLVSSTILATVGPYLYLYVQRRTEEKLFQEQRRYQTTLRQASYGMGRIKDLKRLLNLISHIVIRTVGLEHSIVYTHNKDKKMYLLGSFRSKKLRFNAPDSIGSESELIKRLTKYKSPIVYDEIKQLTQDYGNRELTKLEIELGSLKAAVVVPSFIDETLIAFIILGNKVSGKSFTQDDLAVFTILANQAALAIENAQFYEDVKKTHAQLVRAEKMATIGTMADGLSHQINNRLHALGFIAGDALDTLKLKEKDKIPEELKEFFVDLKYALTRIQENVAQGGDVVQGLLRYTRKGEEGFAPVDLDKLIDAALEMTQFKIKQGEMAIIRDYNGHLPKIKGNFTQLQEVFFNMIDNAYDAMMQRKTEVKEQGYRPTLRIGASSKGNNINIKIKDNGIGVKDEDKEKLFTPFFTTKLSSKKGTGLGLYVIQKIIEENHGGKVKYASRYMDGTEAYIQLPVFN